MSRFFLSCAAALLGLGAAVFHESAAPPPDVTYGQVEALLGRPAAGGGPLVEAAEEAVRWDPANPFAWADLGEAYARAGRSGRARSAFATAVARGGGLTAIALRAAAFELRAGTPAAALPLLRGVLLRHPEFATPIFDVYRAHRLLPPERLELGLPPSRAAAGAYFRYLLAQRPGQPGPEYLAEIESIWASMARRWPESPGLADGLVRLHVAEQRFDEARALWRTQIPAEAGNLLSNGGWERTPAPWLFDWSITPWPHVEAQADGAVAHSGRSSLRLRFDGLENPAYSAVAQRVVVEAGKHCLSFWGRTAGLTSDEGVGVRLFDPADPDRVNLFVVGVREPTPWREWRGCLEVPATTRLLELQIIRSASNEPRGRIEGTVWLDDFVLQREAP